MPSQGDIVQAQVEKLIPGGKGLIRYEGWVIFVDDVIPGEIVSVELVQKKKSYFVGKLVKIIQQSPLRVVPLCPHFGVCGGCQLQHIKYDEQVRWKSLFAEDALKHMAKLDIPPIMQKASPLEYEYRKKITLHFQIHNGRLHVGYIHRDNETVFSVKACPIFLPESDPFFEEVHRFFSEITVDTSGRITVLKYEKAFVVHLHFATGIPQEIKHRLHHIKQEFPRWRTVVVESTHERVDAGDKELSFEVEGLKIFFSTRVFLQNHPWQSHLLYQDIVSTITTLAPEDPIVDLYSGVGILSQLLARQGRAVVAVEANKEAVLLAQKGAAVNGIGGITFHAAKVEASVKFWPKEALIIANPPRIGLSAKAVADILAKKPELFIYISCMPTTLARDLTFFRERGYKIESLTVYDMFPQTAHLETVAVCRKEEIREAKGK